MINNNLYQSAIIAIPLSNDEEFPGIQPTYLVIDNIFGKYENQPFIDPVSGEEKFQTCTEIIARFAWRGEWTVTGMLQEMVFPRKTFNYRVPYNFTALTIDHQTLVDNSDLINAILSLFTFDDGSILENFIPMLDVEMCNEITKDKADRIIVQHISMLPYQEDVDEYLAALEPPRTIEEFSEYDTGYENKPVSAPEIPTP